MIMRLFIGIVASLCLCEASQVLANDPPPAASTAADPGQSKAPAPAATPSPAAAPAAANSAATPATSAPAAANSAATSDISPEEDKKLRSQGYKRVVQHGNTYYCRSEPVLGSRFDKEVCKTPERMADERVSGREVTDRSQIRTLTSK